MLAVMVASAAVLDCGGASATRAAPPGADGGACMPALADAGLVDRIILGLPAIDVVAAPPVTTNQVVATPAAEHYPKQVGVLNLSPAMSDAQSVVHMLAPMGIPYAVTTSPVLAIQHDMAVQGSANAVGDRIVVIVPVDQH